METLEEIARPGYREVRALVSPALDHGQGHDWPRSTPGVGLMIETTEELFQCMESAVTAISMERSRFAFKRSPVAHEWFRIAGPFGLRLKLRLNGLLPNAAVEARLCVSFFLQRHGLFTMPDPPQPGELWFQPRLYSGHVMWISEDGDDARSTVRLVAFLVEQFTNQIDSYGAIEY